MNNKKQPSVNYKKAPKKSSRYYPERITITTPRYRYTHTNPSGKGMLIMFAIILAAVVVYWLISHSAHP